MKGFASIFVGLILTICLLVDLFHLTAYYEFSHYAFYTIVCGVGVYFIKGNYLKLLFLYSFIESATNTYLTFIDSYAPNLQIVYIAVFLFTVTLNYVQKQSFHKTVVREGRVYKIYKVDESNQTFYSFLISLFTGYPIVSYYYNGRLYFLDKKTMMFKFKRVQYNEPIYARQVSMLDKYSTLVKLEEKVNTKYHLIKNNCFI